MKGLRALARAVRGALRIAQSGGLREGVRRLEEQAAAIDRKVASVISTLGGAKVGARWERDHRARWLLPDDLRAFEQRVYSQNGEDGIIEEILNRIGEESKYFVEIGVESGIECNCARLVLDRHWSGLFIEGNVEHFQKLRERYRSHVSVRCVCARVTSNTVEQLLAENHVPHEFDLLSIDIDGNDYWVWAAIMRWRPRIVIIEYNAVHPPWKEWVMEEDPDHVWDGSSDFGASLASLASLGERKGYTLVGTNSTGVNAFFVRDDLKTDKRFLEASIDYHYSPPR